MHAKHAKVDLHEAAFTGNVSLLRLFLDEGQDADVKTKYGQTPLHKAAMNGNLDCAKLLISRGAQTHMQDEAGCTPLHYAAGNGHLTLVKWLIQEADVNLTPQSKKGRTPRTFAKRNGHRKVVIFLAEMGRSIANAACTCILDDPWDGGNSNVPDRTGMKAFPGLLAPESIVTNNEFEPWNRIVTRLQPAVTSVS